MAAGRSALPVVDTAFAFGCLFFLGSSLAGRMLFRLFVRSSGLAGCTVACEGMKLSFHFPCVQPVAGTTATRMATANRPIKIGEAAKAMPHPALDAMFEVL